MFPTKTIALSVGLAISLAGCASNRPDAAARVHNALNQPQYKDVSVSEDRSAGVVTLKGHVGAEADKDQAAAVAQANAPRQIISNQIEVLPPGDKGASRVNADVDKAIGENLDAALIQNRLHKNVDYKVNNSVVTLSGKVRTQGDRNEAQQIAASVPNVSQVVNELQVKNQPATSQQ